MAPSLPPTTQESETRGRDKAPYGPLPRSRVLGYLAFLGATLLLFRQPLEALTRMALEDQRHTHVILMPCIAITLIGLTWRRVFEKTRPDPRFGLPLLLMGAAVFALGALWASLPLQVGAIAILWIAGFLTLFGRESLWAGRFPLSLLALFVPLPLALLDAGEVLLQQASAEVTEVLFHAIGTPLFREGMRFAIPGVVIEVARECSGIRSTIVLMLVALMLGYLFLRSNLSLAILVALAVPLSIFKNAIRIVALSWLGTNVSMEFLTGDLHHHGGPVFSLISLALLVPFFVGLQRLEGRRGKGKPSSALAIDSGSKAS